MRITHHGDCAIISNVANGKWIKLAKSDLAVFEVKSADELVEGMIASGVQHDDAEAFMEMLAEYGFISGSVVDPSELSLRATYLNITSRCNLACGHCYFGSAPNLSDGLDTDGICALAQSVRDANVEGLVISGGEPLVRPDFVSIMRFIAALGFSEVTLLTNGTLMNSELAREIAACATNVHVSVDGPTEEVHALIRGRDNFERTIRGIELLKDTGVASIRIITSVTSANIAELPRMRDLADRLGASWGVSVFAAVGRGDRNAHLMPSIPDLVAFFREEIQLLRCGFDGESGTTQCLEINAGVTCGSGIKMVSVDCFGNVFPCHLLHRPDLRIGNLAEQPNLKLMMSESPVARAMQTRTVESRACHGCMVEYFCKGGCLAHTIAHHNDSSNPWGERDPFCSLHRTVLGMQLWE